MTRRQVLLDSESDRILSGLARRHGGNRSLALREALKVQEVMEDWLDQIETAHARVLREQKERSEKGFREGRFTTWEEVKRRLRL